PAILMCYGIACLMNHWVHQIKYFSRDYQTIVFDYRGHHNTPAPEDRENLTIDAICQDIQGLLKHLGVERASMWGHSYGAQILLRYYDMFPDSVANLVFVNGFASNPIKGMFGVDAVPAFVKMFKEGYSKFPSTISLLWRSAVTNPLAIPISSLAGGFNSSL